jgi:hypothetical protein
MNELIMKMGDTEIESPGKGGPDYFLLRDTLG